MKIKYLGTAAAEGVPAIFCECENCRKSRVLGGKNVRTRSQALIDNTLLIDFPADTYAHFLKENFPLNKIKSCIITHSHMDHLYTDDISMRKNGFAHLSEQKPLTFYSCKSGYDMIKNEIEKNNMNEKEAQAVEIKPFGTFSADGYRITPIKASHDEKSAPVVFAIEKDGKSLLYYNDSSEPCDESMECIGRFKSKPFDLISFDCTEACNNSTYVGHMNIHRCTELRETFKKEGVSDEHTVFVLNHFSHNGKNVVYDEFVKIAAEKDFTVSYDGLEIEF